MWVFLNNAFLSIVAHRDKPEVLLVRARFRDDIARVFPEFADVVKRTPAADYLFRAEIPRAHVAEVMAYEAQRISATNFKNSVNSMPRHDVYLDVWHVMKRAQDKYAKKRGWL